ncbi:MAG: 16S rRNA (cytidine(1402)-2'-O)-methyltransferase [Candidatus Taylorbacteria bacterium]|nr:16S rRNA (cytidine(1402)-2'-O)-methyltransferase [Candidatus Taylorbacteria bacterium]
MLYIVATPIGNLEDITLRAISVLRNADFILAEDTRVTRVLLDKYNISVKVISYHQHSGFQKIEQIVELLKDGKNLALVTDAGTPGINDPGNYLVMKVLEAIPDLKIVPIPGANAAITALSISGFPSDKFIFLGFPPHKKGRRTFFQRINLLDDTIVFYESKYRILKALRELKDFSVIGNRQIVIARELTKQFETLYRGTVGEIMLKLNSHKDNLLGEFVVVIEERKRRNTELIKANVLGLEINMSEKIPTIETGQDIESKREIELKEVAELEVPIKKIIEKIRARIDNGEYGLIIGDDASGRIPALILGNFIRNVMEAKGMAKPNIIFIPGSIAKKFDDVTGEEAKKELGEHIKEWGAVKDKRILIITDTVISGMSLKLLVELLKDMGYICDIATIGLEQPIRSFIERKINLGNTKIISGKFDKGEDSSYRHTPNLYSSHKLSGVYKVRGDHVSTSLKSGYHDEEDRQRIQDRVNQSRDDGKILTDQLVDWYESR